MEQFITGEKFIPLIAEQLIHLQYYNTILLFYPKK